MLPGVENLSGIRTFRVLRALRTISAVKGRETFAICVFIKANFVPKSCCARIAKLCCITEPLNKAEGKVNFVMMRSLPRVSYLSYQRSPTAFVLDY